MISGKLIMEDLKIMYRHDDALNVVTYTVCETVSGTKSTLTVPSHKFFSALAIAIHFDGTPNYHQDYQDAEAVQPKELALRWIP